VQLPLILALSRAPRVRKRLSACVLSSCAHISPASVRVRSAHPSGIIARHFRHGGGLRPLTALRLSRPIARRSARQLCCSCMARSGHSLQQRRHRRSHRQTPGSRLLGKAKCKRYKHTDTHHGQLVRGQSLSTGSFASQHGARASTCIPMRRA
jgi:hypothetical protein